MALRNLTERKLALTWNFMNKSIGIMHFYTFLYNKIMLSSNAHRQVNNNVYIMYKFYTF